MAKQIHIRKGKKEDIEVGIALLIELDKYHIEHFDAEYYAVTDEVEKHCRRILTSLLRKRKSTFFVAEKDSKIVGLLIIEIEKRPPMHVIREQAMIHVLYVKKEHRSKGIGAKLFEKAEQWIQEQNVHILMLHVDVGNTKAIKFYKKLGLFTSDYTMAKGIGE